MSLRLLQYAYAISVLLAFNSSRLNAVESTPSVDDHGLVARSLPGSALEAMRVTPGDWLDWQDATAYRLILNTVAYSDDEEKDISVADLDKDGWDDIVVVRKQPFSVATGAARSDLLLMNVGGVLTDMTMQLAPGFLSNPSAARDLYVGDFDDDGWEDILIANTFGQQPMYYRNRGNDSAGNWLGLIDESAERLPVLTEDEPLICAIWAGDIDSDGDDDVYLCNYKQNSGAGIAKDFLLINDGDGHFSEQAGSRLGDLRNSAFGTAVQMHDMDNDGDLDVLKISTLFSVAPWADQGLFVLFNDGAGNFSNWQNIAPHAPYMFEVIDVDVDGQVDVFVVDDDHDYYLTVNSVVPDISLDVTRTFVTDGVSGFGGNVHAADMDNDGDLDIATADVDVDIPPCNSARQFTLLENDNGEYVNSYFGMQLPWQDNTYDFAMIDINRDGLIDVFKGGCDGYDVFMNNNCDLAVATADLDNDGLPDTCDPCPADPTLNCSEIPDFPVVAEEGSVARQWNEMLLESIRRDFARPTIHARNLFHVSVAMWDAWAAYDETACAYLLGNEVDGYSSEFDGIPYITDIGSTRDEAISYACYRLLKHRFANSPGASELASAYDYLMDRLGYDITTTSTDYSSGSGAELGNYIATQLIDFGLQDGSNESMSYVSTSYLPVNDSLIVDRPGNPFISDLNRWQPLTLDIFIDQSGNEIPGETPLFLSPEWGSVSNFALDPEDRTINERDGFEYHVYHDPGMPPQIDVSDEDPSDDYKWTFSTTLLWSAHLDASDGVLWEISPTSIGNHDINGLTMSDHPAFYRQLQGGTVGAGRMVNPHTSQPYALNIVPRGDYVRVIAEYWADGPDSETPPGHWFTLLNSVNDHPLSSRQMEGSGEELDELEWDVKAYFMLGGAMHDAAVSAWGVKGWYDYIRPVSAIRAMADLGQSSDPSLPDYHPAGLELEPGRIELVHADDPLVGDDGEHVGKIKALAWRGTAAIDNVDSDVAGVDWILVENWEPYQRPSFVTPPFAGYVSGHSTYSRAAAEVLTLLTGDEHFPGGLGTFTASADEFLVFEDGPSVDVELQWATYRDAADESALSRIWGGIHPPTDDIPGRQIGIEVGVDAFNKALTYFTASGEDGMSDACAVLDDCPEDINQDGAVDVMDFVSLNSKYGLECADCREDINKDGQVDIDDFLALNSLYGQLCGH